MEWLVSYVIILSRWRGETVPINLRVIGARLLHHRCDERGETVPATVIVRYVITYLVELLAWYINSVKISSRWQWRDWRYLMTSLTIHSNLDLNPSQYHIDDWTIHSNLDLNPSQCQIQVVITNVTTSYYVTGELIIAMKYSRDWWLHRDKIITYETNHSILMRLIPD